MRTQCPHCRTIYNVTDDQLNAANGKVRCSHCDKIFHASDQLTAENLEDSEQLSTVNGDRTDMEPALSQQELTQNSDLDKASVLATADKTGVEPMETGTEQEIGIATEKEREMEPELKIDAEGRIGAEQKIEGSDSEVEKGLKPKAGTGQDDSPGESPELVLYVTADRANTERAKNARLSVKDLLTGHKSNKRPLIWSPVIITLAIMMLGQLIWLGRGHLVQYQEGRQMLLFICKFAGCQLPTRKATNKIEILSRIVVAHPKKENTLGILLTITNKAPFPQPYPKIQISLYDLTEERVASRLYQPEDYLGKTHSSASFQSGENLDVEMEIEDPGDNVSGFRFEFY